MDSSDDFLISAADWDRRSPAAQQGSRIVLRNVHAKVRAAARDGTLRRLLIREYGPLLAWVAAWVLVVAVAGHAHAVRLLAAIGFVRSARYLTGPTSGPSIRRRIASLGRVHGQARRTVLTIEVFALVGSAAIIAILIVFLNAAGQQVTAFFCAILSITLPVKAFFPLASGRKIEAYYQPLVSVFGLLFAIAAWFAELGLVGFAIAFAAREWMALGVAYLLARPRPAHNLEFADLHWREVANHSLIASRRRFTYRLSKSLFKFMFGPFGTIAVRTGRGLRADRKLERFVPHRRWSMATLFVAMTAAALAIIILIPEPALLLIAATLMRIGATAGNILIWSILVRGDPLLIDDGDEEDDD